MSIRQVNYSAAGTDVKMQLRFFKALSVESAEGLLSIKVWLRMQWSDLRLSWNPADYGGITTVQFHASSFATPEDSEIWLPDITAYAAHITLTYHPSITPHCAGATLPAPRCPAPRSTCHWPSPTRIDPSTCCSRPTARMPAETM